MGPLRKWLRAGTHYYHPTLILWDCVRIIWILNVIQFRCVSIISPFCFLCQVTSSPLSGSPGALRTAPRTERVSIRENLMTGRHPLKLDNLNGFSEPHCAWQITRTRGIPWYWGAYLGLFAIFFLLYDAPHPDSWSHENGKMATWEQFLSHSWQGWCGILCEFTIT